MPDGPWIKVSGAGSRREAAHLGQTIQNGVAAAISRHDRQTHIDTLRLQLPTGAKPPEIERAIRLAIERKIDGSRP